MFVETVYLICEEMATTYKQMTNRGKERIVDADTCSAKYRILNQMCISWVCETCAGRAVKLKRNYQLMVLFMQIASKSIVVEHYAFDWVRLVGQGYFAVTVTGHVTCLECHGFTYCAN